MAVSRAQMNELLRRLEGPVKAAFAAAIRTARGRAKIAALIRAIELGDMDAVMLSAGVRDTMYSALTESIRNAYVEAGVFVIGSDLPKRFSLDFDINNPRAETWLRINSSQLITGHILPEQRASIQTMLTNGMISGNNPRTTALDIVGRIGRTGRRQGGVIGLTNQQTNFVINAADELVNLDPHYFTRKLRDRRFDRIVRASIKAGKPLSKAVREKITARYSDRMLKHRGDTIARTETLQALNEASDEALRQIIDDGLAPRNAVVRVWRHSFSANERPGHLRMNGQERGVDESFLNPLTGVPLKHPGNGPASEVVNCRCFVEHKIDFVRVELAA